MFKCHSEIRKTSHQLIKEIRCFSHTVCIPDCQRRSTAPSFPAWPVQCLNSRWWYFYPPRLSGFLLRLLYTYFFLLSVYWCLLRLLIIRIHILNPRYIREDMAISFSSLVLHGFRHGKDHNVLVRQKFPPPPLQPCRFILNPDLAKFHKAPFFGSFFATKRGHSLLCRSNVLVRISAYISQHKTMYLYAVLGPFLFTPFLRHFDIQM